MNKIAYLLLKKYGAGVVIARIMEQLRLLAECEDEDVLKAVKDLIISSSCDTEYIYNLCEYTNLVTYASGNPTITDALWVDEESKQEIQD